MSMVRNEQTETEKFLRKKGILAVYRVITVVSCVAQGCL